MKDFNNLNPTVMYSKKLHQLALCLLLMFVGIQSNLFAQDCQNDTTSPIAVCNAEVNVALATGATTVTILPDFLNANSSDNCTAEEQLEFRLSLEHNNDTPPTTTSLELPEGEYTVLMYVIDEAENFSICFSTVTVEDKSASSDCEEDTTPPTPYCLVGLQLDIIDNQPTLVFGQDFDAGSFDDCASSDQLEFRLELGAPSATAPDTEFIEISNDNVGSNEVTLWVGDTNGNWGYCQSYVIINAVSDLAITGNVFLEKNGNCTLDSDEVGLLNQLVLVTGNVSGHARQGLSDEDGNFSIPFPDGTGDTAFDVQVLTTLNLGETCSAATTVALEEVEAGVALPMYFEEVCQVLVIDIATPFIRRCATNEYFVYYCNYGGVAVEDAYIEVQLDPFITLNEATAEYTDLGENTYRFEVGEVAPGDCGGINLKTFLSCDALLGQAHLVKAQIFPVSDCNDLDPNWSGASVQVTGTCDGDQVLMNINNVGDGDMQEPQRYVIAEDVLLMTENEFQLASGEGMQIALPANGTTWRIEASQVAHHPGRSMPSFTVEGCGGINELGVSTMFPQDDLNADVAIDYQQSRADVLLNDMVSSPVGYGAQHFIEPNTDLEYIVTFENTAKLEDGTATVELLPSGWLNAATLRPGASNLPYNFELNDGVAKFTFADLSSLEAGQVGFIKFKIAQHIDNPTGVVIENQAIITVNDAAPIRTSTNFHTIGTDYVEVVSNTINPTFDHVELQVFPNPITNYLSLSLDNYEATQATFTLFDTKGQLLQSYSFDNNQLTIESLDLPSGIYFYQINDNGQMIQNGKLSVK